jgi:hypothetical protein
MTIIVLIDTLLIALIVIIIIKILIIILIIITIIYNNKHNINNNKHKNKKSAIINNNTQTNIKNKNEQTTNKISEITIFIENIFKNEIDYNILIIFIGLFYISGSFITTRIPNYFWLIIAGNKKTQFKTVFSVLSISFYVIGFSQLVGNGFFFVLFFIFLKFAYLVYCLISVIFFIKLAYFYFIY